VLQIDRANAASPHIRQTLLASHVMISRGVGGLSNDSVLLCEQVRVIDKSRIIRVLGHLDAKTMEEVAKALCIILGV